MARPGYSRIAFLAVLDLLAWLALPGGWRVWVGGGLLLILILVVNFYRDPERVGPGESAGRLVLAPADGRVVAVQNSPDRLEISIFLSALDVHVNRAPVAGRVLELTRTPGRFLPAFLERSSAENERVRMQIDSPDAGLVVCTQVAGLLARRIENWVAVGQRLGQGERYGMIHLGSRVDLELSPAWAATVKPGDRVKAGASVLAERRLG